VQKQWHSFLVEYASSKINGCSDCYVILKNEKHIHVTVGIISHLYHQRVVKGEVGTVPKTPHLEGM